MIDFLSKIFGKPDKRIQDESESGDGAGQADEPFAGAGQADEPFTVAGPATRFHPLVLAYIGDAIYDLYIRETLARRVEGSVHKLHVEATKYVRCASQSDVAHSIANDLTEREREIIRRGRNAHSGYVPKNANVTEYRYATGFEALLGYLFITCDFSRLKYILETAEQKVSETLKTDSLKKGKNAK